MLKTKINKIFYSLIAVVLAGFFACSLIACKDKEPEFKEVKKITFTCDGETKTLESTYHIIYTDLQMSNEQEYNAAPKTLQDTMSGKTQGIINNSQTFYSEGAKLDSYTKFFQTGPYVSENKGKTLYIRVEYINFNAVSDLPLKPLYTIRYEYRKAKYDGIAYYRIGVKIIDPRTLEIKHGDNRTIYSVTSYSITNF